MISNLNLNSQFYTAFNIVSNYILLAKLVIFENSQIEFFKNKDFFEKWIYVQFKSYN